MPKFMSCCHFTLSLVHWLHDSIWGLPGHHHYCLRAILQPSPCPGCHKICTLRVPLLLAVCACCMRHAWQAAFAIAALEMCMLYCKQLVYPPVQSMGGAWQLRCRTCHACTLMSVLCLQGRRRFTLCDTHVNDTCCHLADGSLHAAGDASLDRTLFCGLACNKGVTVLGIHRIKNRTCTCNSM